MFIKTDLVIRELDSTRATKEKQEKDPAEPEVVLAEAELSGYDPRILELLHEDTRGDD
jgi:hypothetical protein